MRLNHALAAWLLLPTLAAAGVQTVPLRGAAPTALPAIYNGAMFRPLMRSDAAISHVVFNGSRLVDLKGLDWSASGRVPMARATSSMTGTAGPFSDGLYWGPVGGATTDALDSTGDRWGCVAFVPAAAGGQDTYFSNGANAVSGYLVETSVANVIRFVSRNPTNAIATVANAVDYGLPNVACWWRTGATVYAKANLGVTASAAGGTEVSGTAYSARVGRHESAGTAVTGQIIEMVQGLGSCPDTTCEAYAISQMNAVKSRIPTPW